jgi:aspartate aminotransferase-like enzyme
MKALGLELFAPDSPSPALTAVKAPEGIDAQEIVRIMREEHGVTIAGGQAQAEGRIFRIAHMGHISQWDLLTAVGALETTLARLGHKFTPGAGAAALLKGLSEE